MGLRISSLGLGAFDLEFQGCGLGLEFSVWGLGFQNLDLGMESGHIGYFSRSGAPTNPRNIS